MRWIWRIDPQLFSVFSEEQAPIPSILKKHISNLRKPRRVPSPNKADSKDSAVVRSRSEQESVGVVEEMLLLARGRYILRWTAAKPNLSAHFLPLATSFVAESLRLETPQPDHCFRYGDGVEAKLRSRSGMKHAVAETERDPWRPDAVARSRLHLLTRYGQEYFLLICIYIELLAIRLIIHPSTYHPLLIDFLPYLLIYCPIYWSDLLLYSSFFGKALLLAIDRAPLLSLFSIFRRRKRGRRGWKRRSRSRRRILWTDM